MPRDLLGLGGKWVVVTGATRGIGRAIADSFAAAGANLVLASRKASDAEGVAREVAREHGVRAVGQHCDVGEVEQVQALVATAVHESSGALEAVVANAGYPLLPAWWDTPLHEIPREGVVAWFDEVRRVDLVGSRLVTWAALPHMLRAERGAFVYVSSTPALAGYKGTPYTEAKAAILGLMRDVAREYGARGIRANAIAPGNIRTAWADKLDATTAAALEGESALRRWGDPAEVANAAVFLASDLASFVTGQTLVVDGGTEFR